MKTAFIIALCLASVVALIVTSCRRQSSSPARSRANALLRSHLAEGRDYRVFVGVPLDDPTQWRKAQVTGQTLSLGGEQLDLTTIKAFLVVYANGEILSAQHEFFPLPEGVRFVEPSGQPKQDVLDVSLLEGGKKFVTITFGPSASKPNEPGHYSTTIRNTSGHKVRVTRFASFTKTGAEFRLNTLSGDYFSADEFISWYGAPQDGWIAPNSTVADPNNYGGGNGYWVYYFEGENGKTFVAGARVPQCDDPTRQIQRSR